MRVVIFGSSTASRRLAASLKARGLEVVRTSDAARVPALLGWRGLDLVLVDSSTQGAEEVCRSVAGGPVPVVLVVRNGDMAWRELQGVDADGFLPSSAGSAELVARLRAVLRRRSGDDAGAAGAQNAGRGK
jgi:DNA-binding response OmpR family regulator